VLAFQLDSQIGMDADASYVAERESGRLLGQAPGGRASTVAVGGDASAAAHGAKFSRQGRVTSSRLYGSRWRRGRFAESSVAEVRAPSRRSAACSAREAG
jgi:hypothetical protein